MAAQDHALLVGDVLIHAGALVNGTSIVRESSSPETFVDNPDRMGFDNWAERQALFPKGKPIAEMIYARAKSRRQAPARILRELDRRAQIIGAAESAAA